MGGEERQVLDSITEMSWIVASEGIYYYFDFAVEPGAPKLVKFYSFRTKRSMNWVPWSHPFRQQTTQASRSVRMAVGSCTHQSRMLART